MTGWMGNGRRSPVKVFLSILCFMMLLNACTKQEKEEALNGEKAEEPLQNDWTVPGLVDRSGDPIEVPVPKRGAGRTLDVTEFGADPEPGSHDDAAAIRKALEAAKPGDEVFLPAGTYDLRSVDPADESANIVLRSGVHLRGDGRERTILKTSFDGEKNSRVIAGYGIHDVIVADFTITSHDEGPLGKNLEGGDTGGGPMYGVYIRDREGKASSRVLIENLSIRRFERHGISVKACREVTVSGNYISEATAVGPPGARGTALLSKGLRNSTIRTLPTIPGIMSSSATFLTADICGIPSCFNSPHTIISSRIT